MNATKWLIALVLVLALVGAGAWYVLTQMPTPVEDVDEELDVAEEMGTRSVTLYFGRTDAQGFVTESRTVPTRRHRDEEIELVVGQLLQGPRSQRAVSAFPRGTRLRSAFFDGRERILYLDFNAALVSNLNPGSAVELTLLGSVLRTVAIDFPEVEAVQLLVDGLEIETLGGHVDLTRPLRTGDWL